MLVGNLRRRCLCFTCYIYKWDFWKKKKMITQCVHHQARGGLLTLNDCCYSYRFRFAACVSKQKGCMIWSWFVEDHSCCAVCTVAFHSLLKRKKAQKTDKICKKKIITYLWVEIPLFARMLSASEQQGKSSLAASNQLPSNGNQKKN